MIPDRFNSSFITSIKDIQDSIPIQNDDEYELNNVNVNCTFKFRTVNDVDVSNVLNAIKSKGDCEYLNKNVLNDAMEVAGPTFLKIVNASLVEGICPKDWKTSTLCPTQKVNGTIKW